MYEKELINIKALHDADNRKQAWCQVRVTTGQEQNGSLAIQIRSVAAVGRLNFDNAKSKTQRQDACDVEMGRVSEL